MNFLIALLISVSLVAPAISVASDKVVCKTTLTQKVKKKHKKYAGTVIPTKK